MNDKKIIFSGIKPSGRLNIGGYIGALSQWVEMQDKYNCIFCVVDYHAITVKQDPEQLRTWTIELVKTYLAAGIDYKNSILFKQSDVSAHTELAWILNCCGARIADLNKMTQFKDKAGKHQESATVGLYDYPVLMAADILLYNTEIVPVGEDQKQHVELARDIARRFNKEYSEIFKVPESVIRKEGARVMSLQDPTKKMSKSDETGLGCIELLDDIEVAKKKIMRAVTDSDSIVKYDVKNKPAVSNLLTIYSYLSNKSVKEIEKEYEGRGYGDFKKGLAEVVAKFLQNFQDKYYAISDGEVLDILSSGKDKASKIASETLEKARRAIGVR
jgi:tryptophanyl-tRNA synthetase